MAFRFRQFVVEDDCSTMPVGTDAMLLGAWSDPGDARTALDIGTGCGVLALMIAQKSEAEIDAIEPDPSSAEQAIYNFNSGPWKARLSGHCTTVEEYSKKRPQHYGFIISNPPFFSRSLRSPLPKRNLARHETGLTLEVLLDSVVALLAPGGHFATVLPAGKFPGFSAEAEKRGLHPDRMTLVSSFATRPANRVLSSFSKSAAIAPVQQELIIFDAPGRFSSGYLELTSAFHNF